MLLRVPFQKIHKLLKNYINVENSTKTIVKVTTRISVIFVIPFCLLFLFGFYL